MVLQLLVQRRRASDDEGPQQGTLRDKLPDPCFLTLKGRGEMLAEPVERTFGCALAGCTYFRSRQCEALRALTGRFALFTCF